VVYKTVISPTNHPTSYSPSTFESSLVFQVDYQPLAPLLYTLSKHVLYRLSFPQAWCFGLFQGICLCHSQVRVSSSLPSTLTYISLEVARLPSLLLALLNLISFTALIPSTN